jgi:hypothetical protein
MDISRDRLATVKMRAAQVRAEDRLMRWKVACRRVAWWQLWRRKFSDDDRLRWCHIVIRMRGRAFREVMNVHTPTQKAARG